MKTEIKRKGSSLLMMSAIALLLAGTGSTHAGESKLDDHRRSVRGDVQSTLSAEANVLKFSDEGFSAQLDPREGLADSLHEGDFVRVELGKTTLGARVIAVSDLQRLRQRPEQIDVDVVCLVDRARSVVTVVGLGGGLGKALASNQETKARFTKPAVRSR
jgi:hypothetical protein